MFINLLTKLTEPLYTFIAQ